MIFFSDWPLDKATYSSSVSFDEKIIGAEFLRNGMTNMYFKKNQNMYDGKI
jgi:hypothetical protein